MKIKFIQVNCREEINTRKWSGPDYRRAEYVLKYRPDIIFFESGSDDSQPDLIYNKYSCKNKPIKLVKKHQAYLKKTAETPGNGDALSDILLWENIMKLWQENHNVLLYNLDGPNELRREFFEVWKYMYPSALKNWLWWVRIYLREKYMARNVKSIFSQLQDKNKLVIAVFMEDFHWLHVKFLLKDPSKKQIWDYYFKRFKEINIKDIGSKIKQHNKLFYKYWQKISDFK